MKAAQTTRYDKKNINLSIVEAPKPSIGAHEVLIKVSAAGLNPLDNMITRGDVKLLAPYTLPLTAGNELVGTIEEIGSAVTEFTTGERVYTRLPIARPGAFATYAAAPADAIARVPEYLSDIEAAAIPLTALTVMQAFDLMNIEAGKTIFISGGTGGVGAMAIPLAHAKGLKVITNGNGTNKERVLALGADRFIDYKSEDYTQILSNVDYVLDTLGGAETEKQMSIMRPGGKLVSLKGVPNGAFARRFGLPRWKQILLSLAGRKLDKMARSYGVSYDFIFVEANGAQLREISEIFTRHSIKPSIDSVYPFEEVNAALDKIANGSSRGKTVLKIA